MIEKVVARRLETHLITHRLHGYLSTAYGEGGHIKRYITREYCNVLLIGLSITLMTRLQRVQNSIAIMVTRVRN